MKTKNEECSNWSPVTELMESAPLIELGSYASYWMHKTPRRMLHSLSYYKFAAKLIGAKKKVLDVGCNEGLGSWLLAKECGQCKGVDFDEKAIDQAKKNFTDPSISFSCEDFHHLKDKKWDAIVNFDVIEHIDPANERSFMEQIQSHLTETGLAVIGTPSEISQQFASTVSKQGHINIYSPERLEKMMNQFFEYVFLFSAHDEIVHTGYLPLAHYLIAVGCKKKP